ncbi:hypothetical protein Prudu_006676, partial [Prunus dulcis]
MPKFGNRPITVLGGYWDSVHFQVYGTKQIRATEISVISSNYGRIAIPRLFREYQVIVGIPAETFRIMIINLHHIGFQGDEAVTLPKDERCIIEGDVGILLFSIENIKPLLSASILSKMVWLLGQSGGPYAALNFPFGKLGNMVTLSLFNCEREKLNMASNTLKRLSYKLIV